MSNHAPLPPSSASRWVPCPGSVMMEALYPEDDSHKERAAEGDLAHAVCAAMLQGRPIPHGATTEMIEGAEIYCEDVQSVSGPALRPSVEYTLNSSNRSLFNAANWGTPDCTVFDIAHNTLYVWDFKFGHRHVDEVANLQLINYTILFLLDNVGGVIRPGIECHLRVVQPRCYHAKGPIREWTVMSEDLQSYRELMERSANQALSGKGPTKVNGDCRDCRARHACPTLQQAAYSAVDLAGTPVPFDMPPEALGRELRTLQTAQDLLKARIDGLESELLNAIKRGVPVPGWMAKQGSGRKKWDKPIEEVIALGQMMGVDVSKPDVITPTQAIKAGIPAAVVDSYSVTPTGEVKLVRDNGTFTRKIFQGVK